LGNGIEDGKLAPSTLSILTHKNREVSNALEGVGIQPSEVEIMQIIAMSRTNMYMPNDHHVHITREICTPRYKSQLDILFFCSILHIKKILEKLKLDNSLVQNLSFDLIRRQEFFC